MPGESNLAILLKSMKPQLHPGVFVFCSIKDPNNSIIKDAILVFKEMEGITLVLQKEIADRHGLDYTFVAAWITLTVYSGGGLLPRSYLCRQ